MNRLTSHNPDERLLVISANALSWNEIYDKLTEYEDTGLEPSEVPTPLEMAKMACALQKLKEHEDAAERGGWTSVKDDMPPEHDSIFSKFYGTDKWQSAMFRRVSDEVNITVLFHDGAKAVYTSKTHDGIWDIDNIRTVDREARVTHWQPLPLPPKEDTWATVKRAFTVQRCAANTKIKTRCACIAFTPRAATG